MLEGRCRSLSVSKGVSTVSIVKKLEIQKYEGTEENNGYVVFENIHRSACVGSVGSEGERRYSACPHSFLQQAYGLIFIDDVNEFSSRSNICFMSGVFNMPTILQYSIRTGMRRNIHNCTMGNLVFVKVSSISLYIIQ